MQQKENRQTAMLRKKEASTLAQKICFRDSGQHSRVSRVCFSFSPAKALAAVTEAAMMGITRKNTGMM